ncbi:MFS transporter [Paracrocinitomix mangrovi]|uniref:MFS transporter n=1 Tax=Paracrocinitomix mangrovi TaxID=2862509 RepID=UPI001C8F02DD|nr:MFS transporter [Paracrocinitomix mangrovi]UKN03107.1 MFS transporter [Paracrocinitomix mangrovi]
MNKVAAYFSSLKDYNASFWMLSIHMFLFFSSFNMLIPEMNEYITTLGGADYKWMILGLWTIAAAISRPLSGKIADNVSRKSVMYFGVAVSVIISFLYPFFITVTGFLMLRFLHGFSTGFQPTGATALVADVIPQGKRGEAMGIFGVTIALGFSMGQFMGSIVKSAAGIDGLFITVGILGLVSMVMIFFISEDKKAIEQNAAERGYTTFFQKVIPRLDELIGPEVAQPAIITFIYTNITAIYFFMVPEVSTYLGIENKGAFFGINIFIVIAVRFASGKLVDKIGARKNIMAGLITLMIATMITGTAQNPTQFMISALVFGAGTAIISPAVMAWTADLSNPKYKGRGMGTMFIMLELGFLSGNYFTQLIYNNQEGNVFNAFFFGFSMCGAALIYMFFTRRTRQAIYN